MKPPKLSVITVCRQSAGELERTIESVLRQTFTDYEYIFKDGGSTDGTNELIQSYISAFSRKGIRIVHVSKPDRSLYDAMNQAVGLCGGEWCCFLNAGDMFFGPGTLENIFSKTGMPQAADIIYGNTVEVEAGKAYHLQGDISRIREKSLICHQSSFIRTKWMREAGYNTRYKIAADYEFFLKSALEGKVFDKREEYISIFMKNGVSSTCELDRVRETEAVRASFGLASLGSEEYKKKLRAAALKQTILDNTPKWFSDALRGIRRKMRGMDVPARLSGENTFYGKDMGRGHGPGRRAMRILFLNDKRHDDPRTWSGTVAHMAKMLEDLGHEVTYIDNLTGNFFLRCFYRGVMSLALGKQVKANREPAVLKSMARARDRKMAGLSYDLIFTPCSMCLCYLKRSNVPAVLYTDANYGGMEGFYPGFTHVSKRTSRFGNYHEKMALKRCTRIIYASHWAKETAVDCYNIPEKKIEVIPFGANLGDLERWVPKKEEREGLIDRRIWGEERQLLFVGADWERKGGPKAVEAVKCLRERGWKVRLAVVGCKPELARAEQQFSHVYGFLDKRNPKEGKLLGRLYRESTLFFMPSRYECAGIVYAEAAAFCLPSVAEAAGGVPDMVEEGVTGRLLPSDAPPGRYADLIQSLLEDREGYRRLCMSAGDCYEKKFQWGQVGRQVEKVLQKEKKAACARILAASGTLPCQRGQRKREGR